MTLGLDPTSSMFPESFPQVSPFSRELGRMRAKGGLLLGTASPEYIVGSGSSNTEHLPSLWSRAPLLLHQVPKVPPLPPFSPPASVKIPWQVSPQLPTHSGPSCSLVPADQAPRRISQGRDPPHAHSISLAGADDGSMGCGGSPLPCVLAHLLTITNISSFTDTYASSSRSQT